MSWRSPARWDTSPGWNFPPPELQSTPRRQSPMRAPFRSPVSADRFVPYHTPPFNGGYRPRERFQSHSERPFRYHGQNREHCGGRERGDRQKNFFIKEMLGNPWEELERDFSEYKDQLFAEADKLTHKIPCSLKFSVNVQQKRNGGCVSSVSNNNSTKQLGSQEKTYQPPLDDGVNYIPLFSQVIPTPVESGEKIPEKSSAPNVEVERNLPESSVKIASPGNETSGAGVAMETSETALISPISSHELLPPSTFQAFCSTPGVAPSFMPPPQFLTPTTAPGFASETPTCIAPGSDTISTPENASKAPPSGISSCVETPPTSSAAMLPSMFNPNSVTSPPMIGSSIGCSDGIVCPVAVNVGVNSNPTSS